MRKKTIYLAIGFLFYNASSAFEEAPFVELPPYVVQGFDRSQYGGYTSEIATQSSVAHDELPVLVNVLSEYLLSEQQAIDPSEAFKNVSSVEAKGASSGLNNQVSIRGFNSFTFIDGFRVGNSNSAGLGALSAPTEIANLERIEVLKGPSSTRFGRGLPGGVVNYVTKKPQLQAASSLTALTGSDDLYRVVADSTGPVNDTFQYRLVASATDRESYRDSVERRVTALYPSINWQISEAASLLIQTEYQKYEYTPDQGSLFFIDGTAAPVSSESFFFGRSTDQIETEQVGINAQFELSASEGFTLRALLGYRHLDESGQATLGTEVNGNLLTRVTEFSEAQRDDILLQVNSTLELEHELFGSLDLRHRILFAADYNKVRSNPTTFETPLDFLDLESGQSVGPSSIAGPPNDFLFLSEDIGAGIQDLITVNEHLHVLLAGRYDESALDFDLTPFPFEDDVSLDNWSYRTGIIFELFNGLSAFTNMGSAFTPNLRVNGEGDILFDTQESIQYEVGVKADLFDSYLTVNAAVFRLVNKDVILSDLVKTDQESEGFELDLSSRLTSRTTVLFNYAYNETRYTNGPFEGNELFGTPNHSAGLWLTHELWRRESSSLSASFGANYLSSSFATDANNVSLPESFTVDAGLQIITGSWSIRFNVDNLFDEESYTSQPNLNVGAPNAPIYATRNSPLSFRLSAEMRF